MKRLIASLTCILLVLAATAQSSGSTLLTDTGITGTVNNDWMTERSVPGISETTNTNSTGTPSAVKKPLTITEASTQIAMATADYPVTAGDLYQLGYAAGDKTITYTIPVDASYKVRVANLAVLDVAGITFLDLKKQVESIVSKNYPFSGVQFTLKMPASFTVPVAGEVQETLETPAWALSRLSSVIEYNLTSYSSIRDVTVTSRAGKTRTYDLFKAKRFGDLSQDPYVCPGDVVTVNRAKRVIKLSGEVERPGLYQLLPGEGIADLIKTYGNGFSPVADPSRIEVSRSSGTGEKIYMTTDDLARNTALSNFDMVAVTKIVELQPVMFLEGALLEPAKKTVKDTSAAVPEGSTRIPVQFNKGENYASLVRKYRDYFYSVSDTAHAYIRRGTEHIPVNLNPMLYDVSYRSDFFVEENDILIIPFSQFFVTVSGAVATPGRYPYIPDRDWSYYVALAGGINTTQNMFDMVSIIDVSGKQHGKTAPITPETVIQVQSNSFLYYFNQWAPIVTTTLSVLTTYLTLQALLRTK